jgi:magnesium-transporting ATPase (P-type)
MASVMEKHKVTNELEFNSDRKRMSVIVKRVSDLEGEGYTLLTKGADSIIEKLLAPGQEGILTPTMASIDNWAM